MEVGLRTDEVAHQGKARVEEEAKAKAKRRVQKELVDHILEERTKHELYANLTRELGITGNAGIW